MLFPAPSWLRQDEARIQKVSRRLHTLEEVNNSAKLLHEMLLHYSRECSSEADRELMRVSSGARLARCSALGVLWVRTSRLVGLFTVARVKGCVSYTANTPGAVLIMS